MSQLLPCPGCARHVRRTEATCPFCDASLSLASTPARRTPTERLGRAATLAFGAAALTSVAAGCSSPAPAPGNDAAAGNDASAIDAASGDDAATGEDAAPSEDASVLPDANDVDTGTPVAAYGGPMFDAGNEIDAGGVAPLYGGAGT